MAGAQLIVQLALAIIKGLQTSSRLHWEIIKGFGEALLNFVPEALKAVADAIGNFFGGITRTGSLIRDQTKAGKPKNRSNNTAGAY